MVLDKDAGRYADYGGMVSVKAKRRAIILVASGIDTFSKINYDQARKVIQAAGIPIYIISTGNLFYKKYEGYLDATDSITGAPGRLTFLQAKNVMNTFARESGGVHYEMTYDVGENREPGRKYKIEVKVDVDGDGQYDDKQFVVQHRPFYVAPGTPEKKK